MGRAFPTTRHTSRSRALACHVPTRHEDEWGRVSVQIDFLAMILSSRCTHLSTSLVIWDEKSTQARLKTCLCMTASTRVYKCKQKWGSEWTSQRASEWKQYNITYLSNQTHSSCHLEFFHATNGWQKTRHLTQEVATSAHRGDFRGTANTSSLCKSTTNFLKKNTKTLDCYKFVHKSR